MNGRRRRTRRIIDRTEVTYPAPLYATEYSPRDFAQITKLHTALCLRYNMYSTRPCERRQEHSVKVRYLRHVIVRMVRLVVVRKAGAPGPDIQTGSHMTIDDSVSSRPPSWRPFPISSRIAWVPPGGMLRKVFAPS